ncbi:MAG: ABC transporter permease subunit, partial [Candidatus Aenigmatarchaeota archaeon]
TALGIKQVSDEVIEVGRAFGGTEWDILRKIELPIAFPSIREGINQTIMLSFSMVVIAGFIGAGGLGEKIIMGVQRYNLKTAFEAGITVTFLAIIFDRLTHYLKK